MGFDFFSIKQKRFSKVLKGSIDQKLKDSEVIFYHDPSEVQNRKISKILNLPYEKIAHLTSEDEIPQISLMKNWKILVLKLASKHNNKLMFRSLNFFITKNKLVLCASMDEEGSEEISEYINGLKSSSLNTLLISLLEKIITSYSETVEDIEDHIEKIEHKIITDPKNIKTGLIFGLKKKLLYLHKNLVGNKNALSTLLLENHLKLSEYQKQDFRDIIIDHTQLINGVENFREILSETLEIYLSSISMELNKSMNKLTAYGALILIPTLISGIYGMNFSFMPELRWKYGYLFALFLMIFAVIWTYLVFRKKGYIK